jgi:hypothetical protein
MQGETSPNANAATLQRWRKIFLASRHLNFSEGRLRDKRKSR